MIRLTKIIEDLTKPQVKESVDPSLLILIDRVITDTNVFGGTPEVIRGMTMQNKLEDLAK